MVNLTETQAVNEIAKLLYDFLPGKPHPFADQSLSFPGVAQQVGVGQFWPGSSKLPSLAKLLLSTLEHRRDLFCTLVLKIVQNGMIYRNSKKSPVTKDEIKQLNELIINVGFKIPELWDPKFIDTLPSRKKEHDTPSIISKASSADLKIQYDELRISNHKSGDMLSRNF